MGVIMPVIVVMMAAATSARMIVILMPMVVMVTMGMTATTAMIVIMTRMCVPGMIMRIGTRFGLERARDMRDLASLPAHHFG